jgi:hypothetical protein
MISYGAGDNKSERAGWCRFQEAIRRDTAIAGIDTNVSLFPSLSLIDPTD